MDLIIFAFSLFDSPSVDATRELPERALQPKPLDVAPEHDFAFQVEADNVEYILADLDAKRRKGANGPARGSP